MPKTIILAFILYSGTAFAQQTETGLVTKVLDGGNIVVRSQAGNDSYVRILGVACPSKRRVSGKGEDSCAKHKDVEKCRKKFAPGDQAKAFAETMLLNKTVTLECTERCAPVRQWSTRYVKLEDGSDYSLLAIDQGICTTAKFHPPYHRQKAYLVAEGKAKKNKVGIHK